MSYFPETRTSNISKSYRRWGDCNGQSKIKLDVPFSLRMVAEKDEAYFCGVRTESNPLLG